jgi:hypothetical protein
VNWLCVLALALIVAQQAPPGGHVTFKNNNGHVYRIGTDLDAKPEDITSMLDELAPGGGDAWLASSHDGSRLLLSSERFDPSCKGWACLAVANDSISSGMAVHTDTGVLHPSAMGTIANDGRIVLAAAGGPHTVDLWRVDPVGGTWSAPVLLTRESPFAYATEPALAWDDTKLLFDCGYQPYATVGTAICEVRMDGSGFHVVLGPEGVQPAFAGARTLDHPGYTRDGGIVFGAERNGVEIWRLAPGSAAPEAVGSVFDGDNRPCVMPSGSIVSQLQNDSSYALKLMLPSDHTFVLLQAGDMAPDSLACGG